MRGYESFCDQRVKHLEMIQGVIHRLSNATFLNKRWSFTLTAVLLGFAIQQQACWIAVASAVVTLCFWALDHDFLRSERLFRKLYEHVRTTSDADPFFMDAPGVEFIRSLKQAGLHHSVARWTVFWSRTLVLAYGPQFILAAVVFVMIRIGAV